MLILATRMNGLGATSDLRPVGRLSGFLIEPDKAFVRYIIIRSERIGADVATPAVTFGEPDLVQRQIPICLSEREIEEAAELDLVGKCSAECEIAPHRTLQWAPYWPARDARQTRQLYRLEDIIGFKMHVFGLPVGSLETAVVNTEDWSLPLTILARQAEQGTRLIAIPFSLIRTINAARGTIDLDTNIRDLDRLPSFGERNTLSEAFVAEVHAQFGLGSPQNELRAG